ncbi:diguanylate cyclase (GGDEF)-like protein [Motilibacter peucedani]|uniref:Diguanylate cyclase (GGDEF)-like protein n=1 Tax=Motilibacter peucedani TaxID=598650 RepID=A0A420XVF6_9ACTN|nr:EAL domain-containing protein [Motilibacter peucedani]RKS80711.1 diguanylate cyclase (GGDEF)-like protein [Motilibacter peucedani]
MAVPSLEPALRPVPDAEPALAAVLEHSSGLIFVIDDERVIRWASPAVLSQLPTPTLPLVGTNGNRLIHPDSAAVARAAAERCRHTGEPQVVELCLLLGSQGAESAYEAKRWFEVTFSNLLGHPQVRGLVVDAHDITERVAHEKELEHLAFHDRLTGLPNRLRLERELAEASDDGRLRAVLVLDLDGFTRVNDRLGVAAGDAVLRSTAFRLRREVRAAGLAAFLGGDEFVVVLPSVTSTAEAVLLAERLAGALSEPIRADEEMVTVGASVGVAVDEPDGIHGDELLRRAGTAMHEAKRRGGGCVAVFDADGAARAAQRLRLAAGLVEAERRGELLLHYQPLLRLRDDSVVEAEALLRWQAPDRLVPPDEFIPVAEETGLVVGLGRWALQQACGDLAALALPGARLAVNLSARQLHHPALVKSVEAALQRSGVDPASLIVELTESAVVEDPDAAQSVLGRLKALGLQLALDDFGTGYSSLSYLLRLPVDILKVDRSFAADLAADDRTRRLLGSIAALAHDLGMSVTVEGVETEEQLAAVRAAGADTAQGWLIGRPVPLAELRTRLLASPAS